MKRLLLFLVVFVVSLALVGCDTEATTVSQNLSKDADMFRIRRRIVAINLITGDYLFEMEGNCSIEKDNTDQQLEVVCKTGEEMYAKHFIDVHDGANVTYVVEQLEYVASDPYHYKLIFRPSTIIPSIEVDTP